MRIWPVIKNIAVGGTICTAGFCLFKTLDDHIAQRKIDNIITNYNPEINEYRNIIQNEPEYFKTKYYRNIIDSLDNIKKVKIK